MDLTTPPDFLPDSIYFGDTPMPLFIGLAAACERAVMRHGALERMLALHRGHVLELERLAAEDDQALDLCGRLLGLVLDAANGGDLHALVRLRRGLRLATAFLQLRAQGPVHVVARLRAGDPDLRAQLGGVWADIHLRPRRAAASPLPRYRLRSGLASARLERSV